MESNNNKPDSEDKLTHEYKPNLLYREDLGKEMLESTEKNWDEVIYFVCLAIAIFLGSQLLNFHIIVGAAIIIQGIGFGNLLSQNWYDVIDVINASLVLGLIQTYFLFKLCIYYRKKHPEENYHILGGVLYFMSVIIARVGVLLYCIITGKKRTYEEKMHIEAKVLSYYYYILLFVLAILTIPILNNIFNDKL